MARKPSILFGGALRRIDGVLMRVRDLHYRSPPESEQFCRDAVDRAVYELGRLDILVSNAAHQNRKKSIEEIDEAEFDHTFKTNVYAFFRLGKHRCHISMRAHRSS